MASYPKNHVTGTDNIRFRTTAPALTLAVLLSAGILTSGPATASPYPPMSVHVNAAESASISGPNNSNSLSYSFTSRWNHATASRQSLGVTMPMSTNGMVNVVGLDGNFNRRGTNDRSENVLAKEAFSDGHERAGESTLTIQDSRQVLIGTTRGELINVNPNNLQIRHIAVPRGTATSILNMYDAGPDVILGTRSATYRQADNRGSGEVLKLQYRCTYKQCSDTERWTRYGAPAPGNTHIYGVSAWQGAILAASGDQQAVLSVHDKGQWRELLTVPATSTGQSERFVQARVMGDYLYASYQGSNKEKHGTHVYRLSKDDNGLVTLTWIRNLGAMAWITSPVAADMGYSPASVIYRGAHHSLTIYDPTAGPTGTTTVWAYFPPRNMPEQYGLGALPTSSCWVGTGNKTCATWYPGGSNIVLAARDTDSSQVLKLQGTVKRIGSVSADGKIIINSGRRGISRLAAGPPGTGLFVSTSYFGHHLRQINPATTTTKDIPLRSERDSLGGAPQVEGLGTVGDQLLATMYPQGGTISQIDPNKPVTCEYTIDRPHDECNPTVTTSDRIINNSQARPVTISDLGDGKAAIGSYGARNHITGNIAFYDTNTKRITEKNLLRDANGIKLSAMGVSVIANRKLSETGGWIYYGTNAAPPDNDSSQPRAAIVRYNVTTRETQAIEVPRKLVSDLTFGADGRLYAMTGYIFLTIDPGLNGTPFAIINRTTIGSRWESPGASMSPLADGTIAVVSGSGVYYPGPLYLVDPRGDGQPRVSALGEQASRVVVVDAPSGKGSRWFYSRGTGVYYQDQPNIAGPLR